MGESRKERLASMTVDTVPRTRARVPCRRTVCIWLIGMVVGIGVEFVTGWWCWSVVLPLHQLLAPRDYWQFESHYALWLYVEAWGTSGLVTAVLVHGASRLFGRSSPGAPRRAARFRFGLRALLAGVTVVALFCGWLSQALRKMERQRAACFELQAVGADIYHASQYISRGRQRSLMRCDIKGPQPVRQRAREHLFNPVVKVGPFYDRPPWGQRAVGDRDLTILAAFPHLSELDLNDTSVTDRAVEQFAGLRELRTLYLAETQITDEGLRLIARLPSLELLGLAATPITDRGLLHLKSLSQLRELYLFRTHITGRSVESLAGMTSLRILGLGSTDLTETDLNRLRKTRPDCQIIR